jgi:hypothetical protein
LVHAHDRAVRVRSVDAMFTNLIDGPLECRTNATSSFVNQNKRARVKSKERIGEKAEDGRVSSLRLRTFT